MSGVRISWNRTAMAAIDNDVDELVQNAAQDMAADASANAPVDTGFLSDNIEAIKLEDGKARVQANVSYATYVELGTINQEAQPFMRPAAYKKRGA